MFHCYSFRYILNTCVDPPHDDKVTGLTFQPSWRRHRGWSGQQQSKDESPRQVIHMAITTSLDGRFKSWVLVDENRESSEEEEEGKKGKKVQPSWACRSVGYYHNLPCLGATFSQDGSLLALNFEKVDYPLKTIIQFTLSCKCSSQPLSSFLLTVHDFVGSFLM